MSTGLAKLSNRMFWHENDLVSSGMLLQVGPLCLSSPNWLLGGHPGQARCQTASRVRRPSVWAPTLAEGDVWPFSA